MCVGVCGSLWAAGVRRLECCRGRVNGAARLFVLPPLPHAERCSGPTAAHWALDATQTLSRWEIIKSNYKDTHGKHYTLTHTHTLCLALAPPCPFVLVHLIAQLDELQEATLASLMEMMALRSAHPSLGTPLSREEGLKRVLHHPCGSRFLTLLGYKATNQVSTSSFSPHPAPRLQIQVQQDYLETPIQPLKCFFLLMRLQSWSVSACLQENHNGTRSAKAPEVSSTRHTLRSHTRQPSMPKRYLTLYSMCCFFSSFIFVPGVNKYVLAFGYFFMFFPQIHWIRCLVAFIPLF